MEHGVLYATIHGDKQMPKSYAECSATSKRPEFPFKSFQDVWNEMFESEILLSI